MSIAVPSRFPEIEQDSAKQIGDIAFSHRMRSLRVPKRTAVGRRSLTWIRNNYRRVVTPFLDGDQTSRTGRSAKQAGHPVQRALAVVSNP